MLARHAENLYWAGRYLERAEQTARIVDVTYHSLLETPPDEAEQAWRQLLDVLHLAVEFGESSTATGRDPFATTVTRFLVSDRANQGSVVSSLRQARENLRSVREMISTECWEATNALYLQMQGRDLSADLAQRPYEPLGDVRRGAALAIGLANDTMRHDDGWRFLTLGRMLERVAMISRLLLVRVADGDVHSDIGFHDGVAILKSVSASEVYRRSHRRMDPAGVVSFLLLERDFPRSVLYCLNSAEVQLVALGSGTSQAGRAHRTLGRLRAAIEYRNADELLDEGLQGFLTWVDESVREISDMVIDEFFSHNPPGDLQSLGVT